ncbi:hypothetical protein CTZ28_01845 [Streptomyces shenzhenensis]|uniref:Uncharacterized protein n=1 Tax=Streptomyces shenzhenensis TaxID=943815 RepID=A0A3M0IDW2_9ACTN|nr:hypothetical protein CTZ28_01845 [Streptomyces shenzhenensis]
MLGRERGGGAGRGLLLGLRRCRAGHSRGEGNGSGGGHGGRRRSFHLTAQDSPWEMEYRANSPFTRPGDISYACAPTPRNTQYAGG